jgi:histone H3/H4
MTQITNPNFIDSIIKKAQAEGRFDNADISTLNLLVELETRHLIETAFKFMDKDRRDIIALADVVAAARELGHTELIP